MGNDLTGIPLAMQQTGEFRNPRLSPRDWVKHSFHRPFIIALLYIELSGKLVLVFPKDNCYDK